MSKLGRASPSPNSPNRRTPPDFVSFSGGLTGITWNHTRGYIPLVATTQRFEDLTGGVEIRWQKRSLNDFGDVPLEKVSEDFDLLVIDHPHLGPSFRTWPGYSLTRSYGTAAMSRTSSPPCR